MKRDGREELKEWPKGDRNLQERGGNARTVLKSYHYERKIRVVAYMQSRMQDKWNE